MTRRWVGLIAAVLLLAGCGASNEPKAPQSCLDALDYADHLLDLNVEALGYASDAFMAAADFDMDAVYAINDKIQAITPQVTSARASYDGSRAKCRAEATS